MAIYEVHADLDKDQLTHLAVDTFRMWLEFAMGKGAVGGRKLHRVSGRYASSLRVEDHGSYIDILADSEIAPEAAIIENGRTTVSNFKDIMLGKKSKIAKDGSRYRIIPIKNEETNVSMNIPSDDLMSRSGDGLGVKIPSMWAQSAAHEFSSSNVHFVTMSDKGKTASNWRLPAMPAYSPAKHLSDLASRVSHFYGST